MKDADEIKLMKNAAQLGVDLYHELLPKLQTGMAENEVAAMLEHAARVRGAEGMSFETIVAGGPRSALPHGRATAHNGLRAGHTTMYDLKRDPRFPFAEGAKMPLGGPSRKIRSRATRVPPSLQTALNPKVSQEKPTV